MDKAELADFLEEKYHQYAQNAFIDSDPISIPHLFSKKEDREIAGFITATISWGVRKSILKNAQTLFQKMDNAPFEFVQHANQNELEKLSYFVHRTFNGNDLKFFIESLRNIYQNKGGLENIFTVEKGETDVKQAIVRARKHFFETTGLERTKKHFSNPEEKSAAKRINMFLRWMVRKDAVDFGIWKNIAPSYLICPLDVHSGRVARKLNLLNRTQNDWSAALELSENLRIFDKNDPIKYDFALFGLGVFEKF